MLCSKTISVTPGTINRQPSDRWGEMTMNRVYAPILAGFLFVWLAMFSLPAFAVQSTAPELQTEQKLSEKKQALKHLLNNTRTPADHLRLAAYYRHRAQKLRNRSEAHEAEAQGYASRSVFEPKTGIPGGLLRHCREWAWRYAEDAKQADALAAVHDKLSQQMQNASESPPQQ